MLFIFSLACFLFTFKRFLRYGRYLQQEEYNPVRFFKWYIANLAFDKKASLLLVVTILFGKYHLALASIGLTLIMALEKDPRKWGKITLKMTSRAKRIFLLSYIFYAALQLTLFTNFNWIIQILLFQSPPYLLMLAVMFLAPDEKRRHKKFHLEAKVELASISPYVIGITGSYGKTSTKNALGTILQITLGTTFWPQKGVNTLMGITREIRTNLKKGTKFAVVEMGAYARGSIKKLADFTPPHAAIITSVGVAHLERFKNEQTTLLAKEELAKAVPKNGILICHGDCKNARTISKNNPKKINILYGFDNQKNDLDLWIKNYQSSLTGSQFDFVWQGKTYTVVCPLIGKTNALNLAASFAMSCTLGAHPDFVIGAINNLVPVDNRLQLSVEEDFTFIRDAYNSNPVGFTAALDELHAIKAKRKILITPGMIELGCKKEKLHENIGSHAAKFIDMAIIVGSQNLDCLKKGLIVGGMAADKIHAKNSRAEAFSFMKDQLKKGDLVLIENDLPDLYETAETF